jgi:Family of unknown function (DUF5654)
MSNIKTPQTLDEMPLAVIKNMITLATSGFGLVVALAWNEVIKTAVEQYIDPILGKAGGLISLFVYATLMTLLAVLVTMQLASLQKKFEGINQAVQNKLKKNNK